LSPAPTRSELLESEKGLLKPAGIAALLGVVLFVASAFIQSSVGGESVDTDAELLTQYAEDGSTLLLGRIVFGLAFLCFTLPLYTLFRAIQARTDRLRNSFIAFCFIGPVLLAIQGPMLAVGYQEAGDKFAEEAPALEAEQPAPEKSAEPGAKEENAGAATETGAEETTTTSGSDEEDDSDEEDTPEEQLAEDLIEDNGTVSVAQPLLLPALLGMVTAMIFINIWAQRVGLVTRFWGSLGIALGAAMIIILPIALLGIVLWFMALGMMYLNIGRRGRPPAWDAGIAIPWVRAGDEPPDEPPGPGGTVEGSGRDVSEGPDVNGNGDQNGSGGPGDGGSGPSGGNGPELPPGPTYPPRKRKRRE
jgi:hypothetical protein